MDLKRTININKKVIVFLLLINIIGLCSYYSYALFQVNVIKNNAIVISTASNLNIETTIDNTNSDTFTLTGNETKTIVVHLTTNGITSAMAYKMYYEQTGNGAFTVSSTEEFENNIIAGIMQPIEINNTKLTKKDITLTFTNTSSNTITIKLGSIGGLEKDGAVLTNQKELLIGKNAIIVSFDAGNLIYGLEDKEETTYTSGGIDRVTYSISNGVVTVTALRDDGYFYTSGRVYLEANKTYIFNCDTDGLWTSGNDTVEAFLMLDGSTSVAYKRMDSNINYEFTPTTTGEYWIRLDVNENGKTYTFSNISIKEKINSKEVAYNNTYGALTTPTRNGYTFAGWEGGSKNLLNYNEITATAESTGIIVDNSGNVSDSSPDSDGRVFSYNEFTWHITLEKGTYTFSINFTTKAISTNAQNYADFAFRTSSNTSIYLRDGRSLYNIDSISRTFTLNETTDIGILVKGFDGVYKVQLEKGDTATEWEPYYVKDTTTVVSKQDHTLHAKWIYEI